MQLQPDGLFPSSLQGRTHGTSLREDRMSEEKAKLNGPDLTQGVELSTVPDGTMLPGHARGEPVLLVRRGDELFAIVPSARTTVLRSLPRTLMTGPG
jgi:hypothetical protein